MSTSLHHLRARIHDAGGRLTAATEQVFRHLWRERHPRSIDEIAGALAARDGRAVHPASVYRITQRLVHLGLLRTVHLGDGVLRYEPEARGHHHHVVCTACGDIRELDMCAVESMESYVRDELRFSELSHSLEYRGICPRCAAAGPRDA